MPKFYVKLQEIWEQEVEVEADSIQDAISRAYEKGEGETVGDPEFVSSYEDQQYFVVNGSIFKMGGENA